MPNELTKVELKNGFTKENKNGKYLAGYVTINGAKYPITVFPNILEFENCKVNRIRIN